jgi:hypothetical protein
LAHHHKMVHGVTAAIALAILTIAVSAVAARDMRIDEILAHDPYLESLHQPLSASAKRNASPRGGSVELHEIERREGAAGKLDKLAAHRERPEVYAEETDMVDDRRHLRLGACVVAGVE